MDEKNFDVKTEASVKKALLKIFEEAENPITEEEAINKENFGLVDKSSICLVETRTERAKKMLARFVDKDEGVKDLLDLGYEDKGGNFQSYSVGYLIEILNVFKALDKDATVNIGVKEGKPSVFENEDFKLVLAPRIVE